MSTLLAMAFLFLILSSPPGLGVDGNFSACVAATMRLVNSKQREHVKLRPYSRPKHRLVSSREISGCKPRVFRPPPSAPSRYVNYHTLGSMSCNSTRGLQKP
ncbi:hypothetical protein COCNU_scaffold008434G000010 [Cocos nucifera]|nr:hypothetical protein [Cocos nucifera]